MPGRQWVFAPDSGGVRVPDTLKPEIERRIRRYAEEHFAGRYTRLDVRFRGQFCYIDAYTEPDLAPGWPPPDWHESREEMLARLRETPTHLCRLRYFGDRGERWGFAFYTYSGERYELAIFPSGEFFGPPEEAFRVSAEAYLR
ncbi:MAG TPA: hypothetical protein VFW96_22600 [Thermomicrobiales bacterium]|nr:hypothetical protein [Thermomicrobiales bacterium]